MNPRSVPRLLLEWLLGFVGVVGAALCLITSFEITLPEGGYFLVLGALLLAFCAFFRLRQGNIISAVVGAVLIVAAVFARRSLISSFSRLWDVLAEHFARGYDYDFLQGHEAGRPAQCWPALWAIGILQVYVTAVSLSVWKRTLPCALVLLLSVGPCFVLLDTPPDLIPLLLVVFSVTAQSLSQSARRREDGEEVRAMAWSSVLAILILGILLAAVPRDSYRPPITLEDITDRFSQASEAFDNRGNVAAGLSGNPDEIDLGDLRRLPSREAIMMQVTAPESGTVYLRSSSYDRFDGESWSRSDSDSGNLSLLYPALGRAGSPARRMTVEPIMEEDVFYTPYGLTQLPDGARIRGDAWLYNPDGASPYFLMYDPSDSAAGVGTDRDLDGIYDAYLELPEQTRRGMLAWWESQPWLPPHEQTDIVTALAEEAAARIRVCAAYSRDPAEAPEGADFCTWFVTEAEEGYCVHYATATVAMLRALDIPARYVTGYLCHAVANRKVDVTNLHAHAWVEYYANGRWNLLEPTPGDATEFTGWVPGGRDDERTPATTEPPTEPPVTEPPSTEPPTEPASTEPPTEPATQPATQEDTTEPTAEPSDPQQSGLPGGDGGSGGGFRFRSWMLVFPGILLALLLLVLRRRLAGSLREKKLRRMKPNDQAVSLFRRYRRLCRLGMQQPREQARRLALKAAFSRHELTGEELSFLRQCVDKQAANLASAPLFKRLYYRYILAVI